LQVLLLQCSPFAQCLLQLPQACGSFVVFTHAIPFAVVHRVLAAAAHAALHVPASQLADPVEFPLMGASQVFPQAPQLLESLESETQAPPQEVRPTPQTAAQAPELHTSVTPQAVPQAPQFDGSLAVLVQTPPHDV